MKKYLVPLLVLVLLLVSVTTVFADRFSHAYNGQGICTFTQHPGSECETTFLFDGGIFEWDSGCAVGFDIYLKEKGKLSPYIPDRDSIWNCKGEGTYYPNTCGDLCFPYIVLDELILIEEITTP